MKNHLLKRIVVTGGPCGGKSTSLQRIRKYLEGVGFQVIVVPEISRMVYQCAGVPDFGNPQTRLRYQRAFLKTQLALEDCLVSLAVGQKTVMLLDRGALDGKAYLPLEQWNLMLKDFGVDEAQLRDGRYDFILHLETAAKGAPGAYVCDGQRVETSAQAIAFDEGLREAYRGHKCHRIIGGSKNFDQKINCAISEVVRFLGLPEPVGTKENFVSRVEFRQGAACGVREL